MGAYWVIHVLVDPLGEKDMAWLRREANATTFETRVQERHLPDAHLNNVTATAQPANERNAAVTSCDVRASDTRFPSVPDNSLDTVSDNVAETSGNLINVANACVTACVREAAAVKLCVTALVKACVTSAVRSIAVTACVALFVAEIVISRVTASVMASVTDFAANDSRATVLA